VQLCERPAGQGYPGSEFFHVRKGLGVLAGDWSPAGDGRGGVSSFPGHRFFADENFIVRHSVPGVLTSVNAGGVHSNASVFAITMAKQPQLGASRGVATRSSRRVGWRQLLRASHSPCPPPS
jgi:cyclophilin family peptidyl-prolyl cis-trans isomerase